MDIKPSPDALKLTSLVTESAADPILMAGSIGLGFLEAWQVPSVGVGEQHRSS